MWCPFPPKGRSSGKSWVLLQSVEYYYYYYYYRLCLTSLLSRVLQKNLCELLM